MNHAGEGLLQAYIDGEVDSAAEATLVAHVATCTECGHELEELRGAAATFSGAMRMLAADEQTGRDAARERILRAHKAAPVGVVERTAPPFTITPIASHRGFGRVATGSLARAAALVLLLAGGAAAMIPGSPLRRWIGSSWDRISSVISPRPATHPAVIAAPPANLVHELVPGAEMSIAPLNGSVSVNVLTEPGSGQLSVRLVETGRATVQTDSSAHAVGFRTGPGRIEILHLGTSDALIQIPRALRSATIEVNGKIVLVKDGESLRVTGPLVHRSENEIVFQTGS